MKYYIGVDGGGTKTAFALFDENKNMLDTVTGLGSNHENIDTAFDGASDIIMEGINALCEKAGIKLSDVSFTLMGLAGIDHPYQYDIMCAKLREKGRGDMRKKCGAYYPGCRAAWSENQA